MLKIYLLIKVEAGMVSEVIKFSDKDQLEKNVDRYIERYATVGNVNFFTHVFEVGVSFPNLFDHQAVSCVTKKEDLNVP